MSNYENPTLFTILLCYISPKKQSCSFLKNWLLFYGKKQSETLKRIWQSSTYLALKEKAAATPIEDLHHTQVHRSCLPDQAERERKEGGPYQWLTARHWAYWVGVRSHSKENRQTLNTIPFCWTQVKLIGWCSVRLKLCFIFFSEACLTFIPLVGWNYYCNGPCDRLSHTSSRSVLTPLFP